MSTSFATNLRILLWGALALLLYIDYQAWMHDYGSPSAAAPPPSSAPLAGGAPASDLGEHVPSAAKSAEPQPASATAGAGAGGATAVPGAGAAALSAAAEEPASVHVRTDVLDVELGTRGGAARTIR